MNKDKDNNTNSFKSVSTLKGAEMKVVFKNYGNTESGNPTDIWNNAQGGITETSIIKAKTGESNEVIYDFDKNTLNGEPMSLEEYQKVKENTIRMAKERGHTLEFISKDGNKAQGGKYE